jgi:hypothetical protein
VFLNQKKVLKKPCDTVPITGLCKYTLHPSQFM